MRAALILLAGATAFRGPIVRRRPLVAPRQAAAIFEQKKGGAALSPEAKAILKNGEAHLKRVNDLEATYDAKSDADLRGEATALREALQQLEKDEDAPADVQARAFALAREAAWRVLQLRAYDVQILGGHAMSTGALAEMATGEGKTLAAVAPTLLGALRGKGALVVTANDYLARRDADSVGLVFRFLGLSVGLVEATMEPASEERREAYACDVTYVSNAEIGFDYLRDQLALDETDLVLPRRSGEIEDLFWWCLVDEADSILIDEARTPLIISETTEAPAAKYEVARDLAEGVLSEGIHYDVDRKGRAVTLNENGYAEAEGALGRPLFDAKDPWAPFLLSALRAKELLEKDRDYLIDEAQQVKLVDAFSGRVLEGRRYADGLQQAVEAKERLPCSNQTRPSAQVTFQSLFRTVPTRLAGMTGTAASDAKELSDVYSLVVVPIPTALPVARKDYDDAVYQTIDAKNRAAAAEVARQHKEGRPVLVGTTSVEASDAFVERLRNDYGLDCEVLSARPDVAKREGAVVAQAGRLGAVTVATNMAGRGTDIKLGGSASDVARLYVEERLRGGDGDDVLKVRGRDESLLEISSATHDLVAEARSAAVELLEEDLEEGVADLVALAADGRAVSKAPAVLACRKAVDAVVKDVGEVLKEEKQQVEALGGLYVVGTERHESVRVDDQLRGRSGRQGDAGASRFFVSVKDPMFVNFGGERIADMMKTFRVGDDLPVEAKTVTDALSKIQRKVEDFNAEQRTNVLKFDDVQDGQRRALYATRRRLLLADGDEASSTFTRWVADSIIATARSVDREKVDDPDALLATRLGQFFGKAPALDAGASKALRDGDADALAAAPAVAALAGDILERVGVARPMRPAAESFTKVALLRLDALWAEHLLNMNYLKENVQLRTLQQTDPFQEYQREGYDLFQALQTRVRADAVFSMVQMARAG